MLTVMSGNADSANVSWSMHYNTGMDSCIHSLSVQHKQFSYSDTQKIKRSQRCLRRRSKPLREPFLHHIIENFKPSPKLGQQKYDGVW